MARLRDVARQRVLHIGAEFRELLLAQGHARGHGVAAALHQQAVGDRLPHRLAEIDAADRAARAGADAAGLERDRKRRPREFLLQPRGDEADHAGMPAFGGRDDHRALVLEAERGQRLGFGLRFGRLLDDAALGVEPVELGRDPRRLGDVAFQQQPHAEIGAADAAAGIDARPQHEAEMPGFRRAVQPRHIHQRGVADMVAPAHRDQALGDEGAVEPDQRRDIGDRAERDMMQHAEQIGLRHLRGPEAALAQLAIDRDQRHQRRARPRRDGRGRRDRRAGSDSPARRPRAVRRRTDGDRSRPRTCRAACASASGSMLVVPQSTVTSSVAPLRGERAHRFGVGAIALEQPVGNVDQRIEPAMAQMPGEQRRRGRAVDIVVAEDRDLLAAHGRIRDALGGGLHLRHREGIGHQLADGRIEEVRRPRRSRRRARPAPAPASPAADSAARSQAPAPRRAHRAGRARVCRSASAARRERPAALRRAMRMREAS